MEVVNFRGDASKDHKVGVHSPIWNDFVGERRQSNTAVETGRSPNTTRSAAAIASRSGQALGVNAIASCIG